MLPDVINLLQKSDYHATMIELGILGAIAVTTLLYTHIDRKSHMFLQLPINKSYSEYIDSQNFKILAIS